jgi:hypothetical protein
MSRRPRVSSACGIAILSNGNDSQKRLPWRAALLPPGAANLAFQQHHHASSPTRDRLPTYLHTSHMGHFLKAEAVCFSRAPKLLYGGHAPFGATSATVSAHANIPYVLSAAGVDRILVAVDQSV